MDLALVPLDDILDELNKRYDACIFAYITSLNKKEEASRFSWHGGKFNCIGLTEALKEKVLDDLRAEEDEQGEV